MSENRCVCCGAVIPEGRQVCKRCEVGTDNNVGSKTADEMFRELGHHKISEKEYIDECGENTFELENNGGIVKITVSGEPFYLTKSEALACAQLIREMGCADA